MIDTDFLKKIERTRYSTESGFKAAITQHPYRKLSPKRQVQVHVSGRVKKGPLESKG